MAMAVFQWFVDICLALQPMKLTPQVISENVELLLEMLPARCHWPAESQFHKLGGPTLLMQLLSISPSWGTFPGKSVSSLHS
jgi:hypothetical protein